MRAAASFDACWYCQAHFGGDATLIGGPAGAYGHYLREGVAAGLAPNALFREAWYLSSYHDVAAAVQRGDYRSGWEHYCASGRYDGRFPNRLVVDEDWYLARYADAALAVERGLHRNAREHYLEVGAREGRDPHAAFDESWYLRHHPEIAPLVERGRYLCGYQYLFEVGLGLGHRPHPLFDEARYRALHPELDPNLGAGEGYVHLVDNGLREGRRWRSEDRESELRGAATQLARLRLGELFAGRRRLLFATPEAPVVSIVLVLFNRAELTLGCLESLLRLEGPCFEVIVVDNASTDATGELWSRVQGVRVLRNETNAGFTLAANQGAAAARGELLLFLNNDVEVLSSSLRCAVARLRSDAAIGAVGARVVGLDGRLQEAGSIVWQDGSTEGYGRGDDPTSGAYLFPREVDYCSGVFLLTPRATFEALGGFDAEYAPAYYEESDYCFRLRQEGLATVYEPDSVLVHFGWASLPDEAALARLLCRNRSAFTKRHAAALGHHLPAKPEHRFPASDRRRFRGRVLYLDDAIPVEAEGSGSPRAREIVLLLVEAGYAVTVFATNPGVPDHAAFRRELGHPAIELIAHLDRRRFPELWAMRRTAYDLMIVSRWHNFRALLEQGFDPAKEAVRLIYDAECLTSARGEMRARVAGLAAPAEEMLDVETEIGLARRAREIWAVSAAEAARLAGPSNRVSVVSHAVPSTAGPAGFEERRGLLFVGRLAEPWSPNVDGIRWYLNEIHPLVEARLGPTPVTVVGESDGLELPPVAGVQFAGRVDDLAPLFDRHRVFVAPTRFAAGIPIKILTAAGRGVPVVATSLLTGQLGWESGVELLDGGDNDAACFAAAVVELYSDAARWAAIRRRALARVQREHSREALRCALAATLKVEPALREPGPTGARGAAAIR